MSGLPFSKGSLGRIGEPYLATHALDDLFRQVPSSSHTREYVMPDGRVAFYTVGTQRRWAEEEWWKSSA